MPLLLRWSLVGLIAVAGCDLYGTPDRHIDTTARPPVAAAVNFTDLPNGQVLTGDVPLQIDIDSLNQRAVEVTLSVDTPDAGYPIGLPLPQPFVLPTADFPDGPHTLILAVRDGTTRLGLGGLGTTTTHVFSVDVVFQQTPLVGPTIESLTWDDDGIALAWTANTHPFFSAYRVMRRAAWDGPAEWTEAAYFTDRAATSFTELGPAVIGAGVTYRVDVETATEGTVQSELASVRRGTAAFAGAPTRRPFVAAGRDAFVVERPDGMLQGIANDGDAVRWETYPWIPAEDFNYVMSLVPTSIAADGSYLVARVYGQAAAGDAHDTVAAYRVNLDAPGERARRIPLSVPIADIAAGRDGRLVVLDSTGTLHVEDAASGTSLGAVPDLSGTALRVTGDRTTALVLHYTSAGRCVVTSVDVSTDAPRRLAERPIPQAGAGCDDSVFEGAATVIVRRSLFAIEQWSARTLETKAMLDLTAQAGFNPADWIRDVLTGARGTYLAVQRADSDDYTAPRGAVLRVEPSTLQIAQRWTLQDAPYLIGAPDGEPHLFVYSDSFDANDRPESGPTAWKIALP